MAKIMLVEDDNSLREIYEARLAAEGYVVVTAKDGEEALAIALKEHPDLIIADIMMPKVSGFDMLDILRSTPETKGTKIIMMTALSQAEDKARAEKLGADKYLVKSQVTLEDVTREAREMLAAQEKEEQDTVTKASGAPSEPAPQPDPAAAPQPAPVTPPAPATPTPPPTPPTQPKEEPGTTTSIPVAEPPADQPVAEPPATGPKQIAVTSPDDSDNSASSDDPFLASNPTLSSSADSDNQQAKAEAAVDSLTSGSPQTPETPAKPAEADKQPDKPEDSSRDYVGQSEETEPEQPGLQHNKRIEPTPDANATRKPDLGELLAKENSGEDSAPPAVNSIISPDGGDQK